MPRPLTVLLLCVLLTGLLVPAAAAAPPAAPAAPLACAGLFFSEYIEGSSNNKALEIYNGTGAAVDLAAGGYSILMYFNGSASAGTTINLTGAVADGDVYVVAHASANSTILGQADQTSTASWYNGDDAVVLRQGAAVVDAIGQIGLDPGTEWGTGLTSTADNTLRRKSAVTAGDTNSGDAFDPAGEWDGYASDTADGLGAHTATCGAAGDTAPAVTGTTPASGATGVPAGTALTVNFSEAVSVAADGITLACPAGTPVALTGLPAAGVTSVTLTPAAALPAGVTCTATVQAAAVTDDDATDPPDNLAADTTWSFTVAPAGFTPISAVQGRGATAATGTFTVEAIVVGDYQGATGVDDYQLDGFFIQEEDADADGDPATSEGIFVYCQTCPTDVTVGDRVQVTGATSEYYNMSQLNAQSAGAVVVVNSGNALPTPASLTLPVPGVTATDLAGATAQINAYYESYEGMLVRFPAQLSVTEYFELFRYGQLVLSQGGRFRQYTDVAAPSAAGYTAHQIDLARRTVILDDDSNQQNHALMENPDLPVFHPIPGFSVTNYVRGGDTITDLTGVLHWSFAGLSGTDAWRIRPVTAAFPYAFTRANPRPAVPAAAGNVRVASFNVLNYFTTLDARGADSAAELDRQAAKIVAAMQSLDADVVGLMEIENNGAALNDLVARLNAQLGASTYAAISTGAVGTDEITTAMIYKPARVTPVGPFAALTAAAFTDPYATGTQKSRPALAQTFEEQAFGERFTVVVNHLKSKGSCPTGSGPDADQGDGQGCWNATRAAGAAYLVNTWLPSDPTGAGDPDVIILGDLNSYRREDPITAIKNAGYTDAIAAGQGAGAYGYVFDGQLGYLDHALASAALAGQVTAAGQWHINADEVNLLDYNDTVQDAGESDFEAKPSATELYAADPYRSSDHDPVLVGLGLYPDQGDAAAGYGSAWHTGQGALRLGSLWTAEASAAAGGDDASDDGVAPVAGYAWNAANGGKLTVTVTGGTGYVSCWADWNGSGDFTDAERALTNVAVAAGPAQEIAFALPAGVTVSGALAVRCRLYAEPQLDFPQPTGRGDGGEVEDYVWSFGPNAVRLAGFAAAPVTGGLPWAGALALAAGLLAWRRRR